MKLELNDNATVAFVLLMLLLLLFALMWSCKSTEPDDCREVPSAVLNDHGDTVMRGTLVLCGGSTLAP